jgi:hypothetical protein
VHAAGQGQDGDGLIRCRATVLTSTVDVRDPLLTQVIALSGIAFVECLSLCNRDEIMLMKLVK